MSDSERPQPYVCAFERVKNNLINVAVTNVSREFFDSDFDPEELEIRVLVNGYEVHAKTFFDHLEGQLDQLIKEKAYQLLEEKLYGIADAVDAIRDNVLDRAVIELDLDPSFRRF